MKHKILIISPTPTHPTNAGNRARILVYTSILMSQGHEVHFLYSDQESCDLDAMRQFWRDRFHYAAYKAPRKHEYPAWIKKINSNYRYYSHVDDHYNELLDPLIRELHQKLSFTAVVAEYIFLSRALLIFGEKVIKVIDTHDVMTNRHKHFLRAGKPAVWYSTSRSEEKIGINRADIVMAIQNREAAFYRTLCRNKVTTLGHMVPVGKPFTEVLPRKRILFLGSNNPNNLHAINDFFDFYFPKIIKRFPELLMYIGGRICDVIDERDRVIKLGERAELKQIYDQAEIVLNPLTIGTGLKIKMVEAIGLGKVVISTSIGAEGLEAGAGSAYLIADTPEKFLSHLEKLIEVPGFAAGISVEAVRFATKYNQGPVNVLREIFS